MRLGFTIARYPSNFPILLAKPSIRCTNLHRPICSSPPKPRTPLFLRPSTHSATVSDLKQWYDWAKTLAAAVGSTFVDSDNGPDSTLLCRELKWLMEDAVELDDESMVVSQMGIQDQTQMDKRVRLRLEMEEFYSLWKQRIEGRRPFQYIVGCEHWRDLVLSVEEGVLIPRPETEMIVDLVGDLVSKNEELRKGLWGDLGTGSGAIAIGIGRVLHGHGRVIATDLSPVAVSVASYNVQRYGLEDVIEVREGSWFQPLKEFEGKFAGFVSNPPYIPSRDISGLQAEVGNHEPKLALDGGENGVHDLLHLCNGVASMLIHGGFFAFETNGEGQSKFLVDYMKDELGDRFCNVSIVSDFAGIKRFVTGFRQ